MAVVVVAAAAERRRRRRGHDDDEARQEEDEEEDEPQPPSYTHIFNLLGVWSLVPGTSNIKYKKQKKNEIFKQKASRRQEEEEGAKRQRLPNALQCTRLCTVPEKIRVFFSSVVLFLF